MHSKPISVTLLEKPDGDVDFLQFVFLVRGDENWWFGAVYRMYLRGVVGEEK